MSRIKSGFATLREMLSYGLGAGVLIYGIEFSAPDRAYLAVGAGLALLGAPIVGNVFESIRNAAPAPAAPPAAIEEPKQ